MSRKKTTRPVLTRDHSERHLGKTYEHPAFGMISFSNTQGGDKTLFGSDIKHNETVRLRIQTAELNRGLSRDWFHPRKQLIEVEMSYNQWSTLISNGNTSGVPCTLLSHQTDHDVDHIEFESKHELHKQEINEYSAKILRNLKKAVEDLEALSEGKTIKKGEFNEVLDSFKHSVKNIESNLGFAIDQHKEMMDKTVTSAKHDIEAHILNKIHELGLESLQDSAPKMIESEDDENTD